MFSHMHAFNFYIKVLMLTIISFSYHCDQEWFHVLREHELTLVLSKKKPRLLLIDGVVQVLK